MAFKNMGDLLKRAKLASKLKVDGEWAACSHCNERMICFKYTTNKSNRVLLCNKCLDEYIAEEGDNGKQ